MTSQRWTSKINEWGISLAVQRLRLWAFKGRRFDPWPGTEIPHALQCGQNKIDKRMKSLCVFKTGPRDTTERLHFHFSLSCIGEGNGNPFQCSCLENPRNRGAWWAAISGVAHSRTRLKRLSSSSSSDWNFSLRLYMAGWHHRFNGREFEGTLGDGDGQGGLAYWDSWGCKESDMTERLNWTELIL